MTYNQWLKIVNTKIQELSSTSIEDLVMFNSLVMFKLGCDPNDTAIKVLLYEGYPQDLIDELC